MRRLLAVALLSLALPALAQDASTAPAAGTAPRSAILTLDQERLFRGSRFGQSVMADLAEAEASLLAENQKILVALEAEEKSLADQRPKVAAEEFSALADAFDQKVEAIRAAQDAKGREIAAMRAEGEKRFFELAAPILVELMTETGAVAILDKTTIIISFDAIDVTDRAIARIDATLGADDGTPPQQDAPLSPEQPAAP
jgi:Skp family chaperone for outer membrane proteins